MSERMKLEKEEGRGRDIADVGTVPGMLGAPSMATNTAVADGLPALSFSSQEIFIPTLNLFAKMMNILALALVLTSIIASSLFSPPAESNHQVLSPKTHRLIVVEFERQIPQSSSFASSSSEIAGETKEKLIDAVSILTNVVQGLSQPPNPKITSTFTDTKNKASQLEEAVPDTVISVADKIKHMASQIEETVSDKIKSSADEGKRRATQIEESVFAALKKTAKKTKQMAAQFPKCACKPVKSAAETAVKASKDVADNISASTVKTADMAVEVAEEIRRNLTNIIRRAWALGRDLAVFVGASATNA